MKPTKLLDYEQEYVKVKKNNRQLSKALAEQQQLNKRYVDENNVLQKKLYISSTLNMQYEKCLNDLLKYIKQSFTSCIDLTNNISNTLIVCKEGIDLQKNVDVENDYYKRSNSPGNAHKMQAVKPMVSGHVIHHPTINLSRINQPLVASSSAINTTAVQTNSNATSTPNNEPISNNTNSNNHFDDYQFNLDETEESGDEPLETEDVSDSEVQINRRLDTIIEFSEEGSPNTPNNSITKELRILIEPLDTNSFTPNNTPTSQKAQPKSRRLDDPLEGTSSMLDSSGNVVEDCSYVHKPRNASKKPLPDLESDSETSEFENRVGGWISKRKYPTEKKDVTGQKYKVKRNRSNGNSTSPPTDNSMEEANTSMNNIDEFRHSSDRMRRRQTPKSLVEPSLKKKLRR